MTAVGAVPSTAAVASGQPAAGSSFYLAMRLLPKAQREAMYAVYAFCRAVDDIADEPGLLEDRRAALRGWRADLDALYAGRAPGQAAFLAGAVRAYALLLDDFHAVIAGMETDLASPVRMADTAALDLYCDQVASAVGRLSVRIFGLPQGEGLALAHHLGRALQLTNILRDLDADAAIDRLYLPLLDIRGAGIGAETPADILADARFPPLCERLLQTAAEHFRAAESIMVARPLAECLAPRVMALAYRAIHAGLAQRGFLAPRAKVPVGKRGIALRALGLWGLSLVRR